ncbi:signal peptidase I [Phenylobacterium sp.]|uniref:signal peptidase I n=1 Tax=Phenylobacterium sp. TaxID=1871053 RepID=UPI00286AE003|nr:signal peptidase I [Phenylobacterium sp.]
MTTSTPEPAKPSVMAEIVDTARTVAYALLIALVLRVFLFQPYTIPSASMEPALLVGDYIVVSKFDYGWSRHSVPFSPPLPHGRLMGRAPERGDVVVFQLPRDESVAYIKRVIGLPGDRVQVIGGVVFVNGRAIPRAPIGPIQDPGDPQVTVVQERETKPNGQTYTTFDRGSGHEGDDTEVYIVPADHYFVMGDNRDNSLDSRWPSAIGVGLVPADNLAGKARFVMLSWRDGASLFKPWTWVTRFQPDRALLGIT